MSRWFHSSCTGLSELDLMFTRATSHSDVPTPERHVWELAAVLTASPASSHTLILSFTRRFGRTKSRRVALKCLLLLHRLLRILPSDHPVRCELLHSRTNSLISLYPSQFFNPTSYNDFASFLLSYATFLDEIISCVIPVEPSGPPPHNLEAPAALVLLPRLQSLVDRAMECNPTVEVARSLLVRSTMKQVVRDSFAYYYAIVEGLRTVMDALLEMPHENRLEAIGVYKQAADQAFQLDGFYQRCKRMGVCGGYEYPLVEKIPDLQVRALEPFVEGMWGTTDSSSSSSPPTSMSSATAVRSEAGCSKPAKESLDDESEEKPLLESVGDDDGLSSWEDLLKASVTFE